VHETMAADGLARAYSMRFKSVAETNLPRIQ